MNENPLVSVIVTTYNRREYLKQTIDSILSQTYQNFELIVVDNYSNYDFMGFIESYHSNKIQAFQNHNNGVVAVNRNFGIYHAKGIYLAFCDDDDIWMPYKLEQQMLYLNKHNVDILCTALTLFGDDVENEKVRFHKYRSKLEVYLRNYITPSTVVVRNSALVRFDETPDFNCSEDWALWVKLITLGFQLYQMPTPLVRYRIFSSNLTKKNKIQPDFKAIRILRKMKRNYPDDFSTLHFAIALTYHFLKGCVRESLKVKNL